MKVNKSIVWSLVIMLIVASLYRVIPSRPYGFAPQLAIALFAGAMIVNRKWAILLPLISMFLSDLLYHILFKYSLTSIEGFYEGQWVNYLLYSGVILIGFLMKRVTIKNIAFVSFAGPTAYFIASNFVVWLGGGGWGRPKTFNGLMASYADGLPFYGMSLLSTLFFSLILFGSWYFAFKAKKVSVQ